MICRMLNGAALAAALSGAAAMAQVPPEVAAKLAAMGPRIDPVATGQLYAPLQPPIPATVTVRRDVAYGKDAKETFDLFTPAARARGSRPIVVFVHGGGFRGDDKNGVFAGSPFYGNVLVWAAAHGMVGINMNYPLAPGAVYPTVQHDIASVVAWARAHAAEIGGDPDRVIVWGHSAGAAHVASFLAHPETYRDVVGARRPVAAAILASGPYDIAGETKDHIYYGPVAGLRERSSTDGLVHADVPIFLEEAELDPPFIKVNFDMLGAALKGAGRTYTPFVAQGHNHLSEAYAIGTSDVDVSEPILRFIEATSRTPRTR